ncbi:SDR family NAD(P)-dependent oxidoreductase [Rhodobacteraceae bacterium NNCM2]|nr:SDR family NAD(P)-dependent oxidoreductase [Coraliihabitans acroporae]
MRPGDGAAWVTGASGGIGRALTLALAAKGWRVYATARREDALEALAAEAKGTVIPLPADVTDLDAMRAAAGRISEEGPLALAILNAGIYHPMRAQNFDAIKARQTFDVNLAGVTNALEPILQHMIARGTGHIAITASVAGYRGLPDAAAYGATKAGLIAMAESLAMDLVKLGVRLSVINPGFVETDATAVNEFEMPMLMQPEEAAAKIVEGLERPGFEIRFPWVFALILRAIGLLPNRAYLWAIRKLTGWDSIDA